MCKQYPNFVGSLSFSDGASFHLSGNVNRQNERFGGTEKPNLVMEVKLFSPKVNVLVAMPCQHLLAPNFLRMEKRILKISTLTSTSPCSGLILARAKKKAF